MQHSDALIIIAKIQAIWPQREMSEATVREYAVGIEHLRPVVAAMTLEALKVECKFPPSLSEFLVRAGEIEPSDRIPTSDEAWAECRKQIQQIGSKRGILNFATGENWEPTWSHPIVGRVVENMGWKSLCESTNEVADRSKFVLFYENAERTAKRDRAMTPQGKALMAAILEENKMLAKGEGNV